MGLRKVVGCLGPVMDFNWAGSIHLEKSVLSSICLIVSYVVPGWNRKVIGAMLAKGIG